MKSIFNTSKNIARRAMGLFLMLSAAMAFTACSSDEEAFFTAEESDSPRILNTNIPEWKNGEPQVLSTVNLPNNFVFNVIATPIHYTTIKWYLDDELIFTGDSIDQKVLAGTYTLKIEATTTQDKSTSRTCLLVVNPQDADPQMGTDPLELVVTTGNTVTVHGCKNIDKVAQLRINGVEATNVSTKDDAITFTVPQMADGQYRVVLVDAEGNQYGGNKIIVAAAPVVTSGALRLEGKTATISGINLDKVASLKVGETAVEITEQSYGTLTFNVPTLDPADYAFTGTDKDGNAIKFATNGVVTENVKATVPSETTIWSGSHSLGWEVFDGDGKVASTLKSVAAPGTKLIIYGKIDKEDYHQIRFMDPGWGNLWYANDYHWDAAFGEDTRVEIELTQQFVDIIKNNGFAMAGWGINITAVAYK